MNIMGKNIKVDKMGIDEMGINYEQICSFRNSPIFERFQLLEQTGGDNSG